MVAMTLGLRLNNPGNIEYGPFARKYGGGPGEGGRFAKFPDMIAGLRAQAELLIAYSTIADGHGGLIDTVAEAVSRWCPPSGPGGENRTATENYIALVCKELACHRDDEFDFTKPDFLFWMMTAQGIEEQGRAAFSEYVASADIDAGITTALLS